jgi:hypothetical protein
VKVNTELLLNELAQARSGPQVRWEAKLGGRIGQPAQRDFLLGGGKFGRSAWSTAWPGSQAVGAVAAEGSQPAPDAARRDAKEIGNLLGRVSFDNALNSELSKVLEFNGCTFGSHTKDAAKRGPD